MNIVQNRLIELLRDDISTHVAGALVNINGELLSYPIFKTTVSGNKITKYVYLSDQETTGQIMSATLVDSSGNALAIQPLTEIKTARGFLIAFEFEVKVGVSAS